MSPDTTNVCMWDKSLPVGNHWCRWTKVHTFNILEFINLLWAHIFLSYLVNPSLPQGQKDILIYLFLNCLNIVTLLSFSFYFLMYKEEILHLL